MLKVGHLCLLVKINWYTSMGNNSIIFGGHQLSKEIHVPSTLVISTSIISNNSLSRRENMVLVLTQKSKIRLQNIVEKGEIAPREQFLPFSTIFSVYMYISN